MKFNAIIDQNEDVILDAFGDDSVKVTNRMILFGKNLKDN